MILRQNYQINYKLNATSIVPQCTPGGLLSQGPRRPLHEWPTVKSTPAYIKSYTGFRFIDCRQNV